MGKLFENVEGNKFKLLTENQIISEDLVSSGLKKVFMNAGKSISYKQIETVGMGYIKDINTAKRVSVNEARKLAEEFGYKDNEEEAKFIKDSPNVRPLKKESEMEERPASEEKREVQIGKEILKLVATIPPGKSSDYVRVEHIQALAQELIELHEK